MKRIILIIVVLLGAINSADAFECYNTSLVYDYLFSDYIFIGEVVEDRGIIREQIASGGMRSVVMQVEKSLKGDVPEKISGMGRLYGRDDFSINKKYLIFSNKHEENYHFGYCTGRSVLYENINDELGKIEELNELMAAEIGAKYEPSFVPILSRTVTLKKVSDNEFEYEEFYENGKPAVYELIDRDAENYTTKSYYESGGIRMENVTSKGKYVSAVGYDEPGNCVYIATYDGKGKVIYEEGFVAEYVLQFKSLVPEYDGKWIRRVLGKILKDERDDDGLGLVEHEQEILELDPPECATKYSADGQEDL